jgi:hypothetical protein
MNVVCYEYYLPYRRIFFFLYDFKPFRGLCINRNDWQNPIFTQLVISLNLALAGLRLGLKNRQAGEKWVSDDYS